MQQISPYLPSRFQTAYNANQQQQQQLQKRLWAASQYRQTSGNTVPSSNQYSKPNLSLNLTSIQPLHVASSPRYNNNVSQQQHRLMAAAAAMSMSHHHHNNPSRAAMNRQEHHFPLIYEDTRTPLQLLCNEQSWRWFALIVKLVLMITQLVETKKQRFVLSCRNLRLCFLRWWKSDEQELSVRDDWENPLLSFYVNDPRFLKKAKFSQRPSQNKKC